MADDMTLSESCKSRSSSEPPDYDDVVDECGSNSGEVNLAYRCDMSSIDVKVESDCSSVTEEEERMLSILKEVANKCCHANPTRRPTAEEVLKMLKSVETQVAKKEA